MAANPLAVCRPRSRSRYRVESGANGAVDILEKYGHVKLWMDKLSSPGIAGLEDLTRDGPAKAAQRLREAGGDMDKWAEEARIQGIIGRCPKAVPKIKCGLRSWLQFHDARFGNVDLAMPPRVCDLVAWHATHRCGGTFSNYLNYVKVMCEILEILRIHQ